MRGNALGLLYIKGSCGRCWLLKATVCKVLLGILVCSSWLQRVPVDYFLLVDLRSVVLCVGLIDRIVTQIKGILFCFNVSSLL